MPRTIEYEALYELEDERIFSLRYFAKVYPQTRWEPEDVSLSDPTFYIDGTPIAEFQFPDVITDLIIDQMIDRAYPLEPEPDYPEPEDYR